MISRGRIAGVVIPDFAVVAYLKEHPDKAAQPLALVETVKDNASICAVNRVAAAEGVVPEMTVAQGKTRCPGLVVAARSFSKEAAVTEGMPGLLLCVSPLVEAGEPGCFFLEASGLTRLYKSEEGLVRKIFSLIAPRGYPVKVGLGNNKFVAKVAAESAEVNSFRIVPEGGERRFLNGFSIDRLPVSADTREKLVDLGLKTIGQVAAFPANEMKNRFGEEGTAISRLSRGEDIEFFLPVMPPLKISTRVCLDEPLVMAARVAAQVRQSLEEIMAGLGKMSRGCSRVIVTLHLDNREKAKLSLSLKEAAAAAGRFVRQLESRLGEMTLAAGVTDITVTIPEIVPLVSAQLDLARLARGASVNFSGDEHLRRIVDKLKLYIPRINNTTLPDYDGSLSPATSKTKASKGTASLDKSRQPAYSLHPVAGLRLQSPPRKTSVVAKKGQLQLIARHRGQSRIVRQRGPWVLSGNWWSRGFERLYYEVQTEDRQDLLLFFDRRQSCWFVQGIFD